MEDDKKQAKLLKEQGNDAFRKKRYYTAIQSYTKSLEHFADPVVFSNRAQAELNVDMNILAQMDCTAAIELDPTSTKGFYRRAQAFKAMGLLELAEKDLEKCLQSSSDAAIKKLLEEVTGKKNAKVVEVCPVERDEYLESTEEFVDIPIAFNEAKFEEKIVRAKSPLKFRKRVPTTPKDYQDFVSAMNYLEEDPLLLAEYFLSINLDQYIPLFDDLLDDVHSSSVFGALLKRLTSGIAIPNLADILCKISELNRFVLICAMMEDDQKATFRMLCSFLEPEDAADLIKLYNCEED